MCLRSQCAELCGAIWKTGYEVLNLLCLIDILSLPAVCANLDTNSLLGKLLVNLDHLIMYPVQHRTSKVLQHMVNTKTKSAGCVKETHPAVERSASLQDFYRAGSTFIE